MLPIQQKVPLAVASPGRTPQYPFKDMDVDDFFFIPNRDKNNVATHASQVGKKLGRKYKTQLCWMQQLRDGSWEPADADVRGAVQGIGVWRTE